MRALQADLISRLADDIAHEIRNPLNALVINLEVLRRRVEAGDADAAFGRLDAIGQEVDRVHRTIERLITLLRPAAAGPSTRLSVGLDDVMPLLALRAEALRAQLSHNLGDDGNIALPADRLRFLLIDTGMAALDRAGPAGHLSCTAGFDGQSGHVRWSGTSASPAPSPPEEAEFRLSRLLLARSGGRLVISTPEPGGFAIVLTLPAIA